jgi:hypothetical protein
MSSHIPLFSYGAQENIGLIDSSLARVCTRVCITQLSDIPNTHHRTAGGSQLGKRRGLYIWIRQIRQIRQSYRYQYRKYELVLSRTAILADVCSMHRQLLVFLALGKFGLPSPIICGFLYETTSSRRKSPKACLRSYCKRMIFRNGLSGTTVAAMKAEIRDIETKSQEIYIKGMKTELENLRDRKLYFGSYKPEHIEIATSIASGLLGFPAPSSCP